MIFIFDENLPKSIPPAIDILQQRMNRREQTNHKVEHSTKRFPAGTIDPEMIKNFPPDAVLITMDIGQQRKWQEKILIDKQNVSVVYYRSKRNLTFWQLALLFINSWKDLLQEIESQPSPVLKVYRSQDIRSYVRNY